VKPVLGACARAAAAGVVVAVGFEPEIEGESGDRPFELPIGQRELIQDVAAASSNTVVVAMSGGGFNTAGWLDRVPVLVEAWYPGQEGGRALADVLFGVANPSGRLPITFDKRWEDNPSHDSYHPQAGTNRDLFMKMNGNTGKFGF